MLGAQGGEVIGIGVLDGRHHLPEQIAAGPGQVQLLGAPIRGMGRAGYQAAPGARSTREVISF